MGTTEVGCEVIGVWEDMVAAIISQSGHLSPFCSWIVKTLVSFLCFVMADCFLIFHLVTGIQIYLRQFFLFDHILIDL